MRSGAQLCLGLPVTGIATTGGRVSGIATQAGDMDASRVIVAAGTGAPALVGPLGCALPMLRRPAVIVRSRPLPPLIRHILASPDLELRQEADGRILAPTSPNHQGDEASDLSAPPERLAATAFAHLRAILPEVGADWQEVVQAFRPVPGDGLPVVGATAVEGLYIAVMHSGATLGPLIGELVAREVVRGTDEPLLSGFRPGRFG